MMVIAIIITCELRSNMNNGFVESLSQILTIHSGDNFKINGKCSGLQITVSIIKLVIIITIINDGSSFCHQKPTKNKV